MVKSCFAHVTCRTSHFLSSDEGTHASMNYPVGGYDSGLAIERSQTCSNGLIVARRCRFDAYIEERLTDDPQVAISQERRIQIDSGLKPGCTNPDIISLEQLVVTLTRSNRNVCV